MFIWIASHVMAVAALTALVALVCWIGRFRPAVCHALWLLVLIKLLIPPVISWPWSLGDAVESLWPSVYYEQPSPRPSVSAETPLEATASPVSPQPRPAVTPVSLAMAGSRLGGEAVLLALAGVWLAGTLVAAAIQVIRVLRFRRLVHAGLPAPATLIAYAKELGNVFRMRVPELRVIPSGMSAMAWSAGHSRILIPKPLLDMLQSEEWRGILAHEMAHLKRRDHWVGWLELLGVVVWWWNPFLWYVRRRLHSYAEMACDAWVVRSIPEQRRSYAETLVRIMGLESQPPEPVPVFGMGSGPTATFEKRLVMVMRENTPCRVPVIAGLATVVIGLLVLPGWSQERAGGKPPLPAPAVSEAASPPREHTQVQVACEQPVSLEFQDIHLDDVTTFISDSWGVNIAIDWRVVTPPKGWGGARSGVSYTTDGIVRQINLKDVRLADALQALLWPMNLRYQFTPSAIWISTPERMAADAAMPKPRIDAGPLAQVLASSVSLQFENIHLSEVLEFISDSWGANFALDQRVVAPPPRPKPAPDKPQPGPEPSPHAYVTDGIVLLVNLKDIPLQEALDLTLRPMNITYLASRGIIWVSSYERIGEVGEDWTTIIGAPKHQAQEGEPADQSISKGTSAAGKRQETGGGATPSPPTDQSVPESTSAGGTAQATGQEMPTSPSPGQNPK